MRDNHEKSTDGLTINKSANENVHPLGSKSLSLSSFLSRLKMGKRPDKKSKCESSMIHNAEKSKNGHQIIQPPADNLKLKYYDQDPSLPKSIAPAGSQEQKKNDKDSCEARSRNVLPSAEGIHHDAKLHDQALYTIAKMSIKHSRIPRARRSFFKINRLSNRSTTRYPVGERRKNSKNEVLETPCAPAIAKPESVMPTPPLAELTHVYKKELKSESSDSPDSLLSHSDVEKSSRRSSYGTENDSKNEPDISEMTNPSTDESDEEESYSQHGATTSDAEHGLLNHSSKTYCPIHYKAQNRRKIGTTSEDCDFDSSDEATTTTEPSPRIQQKTHKNKARSSSKTETTKGNNRRGKNGFFCALFDIIFWPFTFFRSEK